jgi:hypothetical protein
MQCIDFYHYCHAQSSNSVSSSSFLKLKRAYFVVHTTYSTAYLLIGLRS